MITLNPITSSGNTGVTWLNPHHPFQQNIFLANGCVYQILVTLIIVYIPIEMVPTILVGYCIPRRSS